MYLIQTKKLGLRKLELSDREDLFEILSDRDTMKYYPRPYTIHETEHWISRSLKNYKDYGFGLWALIIKKGNCFIGQCGISRQLIDGDSVPEIGYQINKKYWNKGFASEASKKCLEYGFFHLGLQEIFIHTYVKNIPSIRVAEKLGMKKRKEYDKTISELKSTMRHVIYSIRIDEFQL